MRYEPPPSSDTGGGLPDAGDTPPDATPPPPDCCRSDSDCPPGSGELVCVGEPKGVCLRKPDPGRCWEESDCAPGETCEGARWCDCETECPGDIEPGYCASGDMARCIDTYGSCWCDSSPDCRVQDGFTIIVLYPEDEGPFPSDIFPSDELLDVGVARYDCAICDCDTHMIKRGGEWVTVDVVAFCRHILDYNSDCGGCLTEWFGGCC